MFNINMKCMLFNINMKFMYVYMKFKTKIVLDFSSIKVPTYCLGIASSRKNLILYKIAFYRTNTILTMCVRPPWNESTKK